jgi:hypothetical protein
MAVPNYEDFDDDFAGPAQWAEMYRIYGLQIIPGYAPSDVKPGAPWKRPLLSEWTTLQNELVPDATFWRWYDPLTGEYRDRRNMGIITGACSGGVFILDLDIHKKPEALAWWNSVLHLHNNGMEPDTPTQKTGGGGLQKLFRAPAGWVAPTNRTDRGVDIRGQGGFAVVPSSLHDSGGVYTWLPGMGPWEIEILEAPGWLLEEIDKLVGVSGNINSGNINSGNSGNINSSPQSTDSVTVKTVPGGDFDAFGNRIDGREDKMFRLVWAAVVGLKRKAPMGPPSEAEKAAVFADWVRGTGPKQILPGETREQGLEREGRGISLFHVKWQAALRQWDTDVAAAAAQPDPNPDTDDLAGEFSQASNKAHSQAQADPGKQFETLDVRQIKAMPDPRWLIDGIVIEQNLGFIYGPPGCLKTFIALDMALSITTGQTQWWGRGISHRGAVIYISSEGLGNLKYRVMAWEQHRKVNADSAPFFLIRQGINFMKGEDIGTLRATVAGVVARTNGPIAAVFVDTVSRVLPGAEENLQKDMTIFVAACQIIQQEFSTVVVGIHHTNKSGEFRGSTVMPGAGDFMIEVRREPGEMTGKIYAKKIKDAEDGWEQHFNVTKLDVGAMGATSSLVVDGTNETPAREDKYPDRNICLQILAAIDEQWRNGVPWCYAKNSSRAAVTNIAERWELEPPMVERLLKKWNANGIIIEAEYDAHRHIKGYRKLVDL